MQEENMGFRNLSAIPNIEITIDTIWLFIHSMKSNMNVSDVIIRYLVIEEYHKNIKNNEIYLIKQLGHDLSYEKIKDLGFPMMALYHQMQYKRSEFIKHISSIDVSSSIYNFLELIQKVEKEGFDVKYPLEINQEFCLLDGAHRLALALYYRIPRIKVFFNQGLNFTPDYSINWFKNMNLNEHIFVINNNYKKIIEKNILSYFIKSNDDKIIEQLKTYFFVEVVNEIPKKIKLIVENKLNDYSVYKLVPKTNNENTIYPNYDEKVNIPKIINIREEELIKFCYDNNIILYKESDDSNV